jgi:hypothetical protein
MSMRRQDFQISETLVEATLCSLLRINMYCRINIDRFRNLL